MGRNLHQEGKGRGIRRERGAGSGGKGVRDQEGKVMGAVAARRQGDAGAGGKVMRAVPVRRSERKRETGACIINYP